MGLFPHFAKNNIRLFKKVINNGLRSSSCQVKCLSSTAGSVTNQKDHAEVVIIGGGAVGTSVAYHLSKFGLKDVVLLEKSELTAGSTWHAAGLSAFYHAGINMKKIHYYSLNLFSQLESETKQLLSFHQPGSIRLALTPERMDEFRYQQQRQGWQQAPQILIDPQKIQELCPIINMDKILGGLYNPADGHIDPNSLTMALAAGARKYGASIYLNTPVTGLQIREDSSWNVETPNGTIVAKKVVNAAGFWAHEVGRLAQIELPLVPIHHQYLVTTTIPQVKELKKEIPVIRHLEGSFYLRQERHGLLVGPYEHQNKMRMCNDWAINGVPPGFGKELFEPDLDRLSDHLEVAMELVPALKTADVQTVVSGPIMYTPDLLPMLGPYQGFPNMWMAAGFSYGIAHSGGAGKFIAEWMLNGEPTMDLIETDPNRYSKWTTKHYLFAKARESYGMNNSYTYPKEERWAGRPTSRITDIYQKQIDRGAEMSFHAGWEQPAWFALADDVKGYKPSFKRTNWFKPVGRECEMVLNKAGIIDLTPFAKIEILGKDADLLLDRLVANNLPKVGTTNISHMLTPEGRVYAELTITKLKDNHYFVITGSGAELHDIRWIEEYARLWNYIVTIENKTEDLACLSVAGPKSRYLLSKLTTYDLSPQNFPFLQCRDITVAGVDTRALSLSYTGELGWELYHQKDKISQLYDALLSEGSADGISDFGTYALNSLRIEKGFRMWGAEMNLDANPYEAGLDFFIKPNKPTDFLGKQVLKKFKQQVLTRKLAFLKIDTTDVDPEGNESIWCSGKVVGYTTSGAYGYQVGHSVAMGYLPPYLNVPGSQVEVELLGSLRQATVLPGAPVLIHSLRNKKSQAK